MPRLMLTIVLLAGAGALLLPPASAEPPTSFRPQALPGLQPGGSILLPNQWSLRPAGKQIPLGDFPVNLALHPSGRWLAVLHSGYGEHEVMIIDLKRQKKVCRVELDQTFYGLSFSPDGRQLFASGGEFEVVHAFQFADGLLAQHRELPVAEAKEKFIVAGLTVDPTGHTLFAAGTWGDAVCILPLDAPEQRAHVALDKESYPYTCLADPTGKRLYVSLWNKAGVAVIDLEKKELAAVWPTEKHPTEIALSPQGKVLFVACANSTQVSVLDTDTGKGLETIGCSLYPASPAGNTPNSLSLTPDGKLLFVANADANNIAVFNVETPGQAKPLGFIPVGWYPTSVRFNPTDKRLYVANGKGTTPRANPQGPQPNLPASQKTTREYIGGLFQGTLGILDLPTPEQMASYSKQAYECSPLRADQGVPAGPDRDNPIPRRVGDPSPIKHCIYIIKENRTYDQVFGDMKEGNGDPNLCLFPEHLTPNHHRLAREFVLLDNFYVDGEVSADGHQWSMGAYATDFVEKTWPLSYRGSPHQKLNIYSSEGNFDSIARPAGGYLWDRCAEAGVSYRNYGEWIANGKTSQDPGQARVKALEGHFDPWFRGFDLKYPDQKRADRFLSELARFEREGDMPALQILRLPNDHTAGTRIGYPTPTAFLADNDLALGRVVEGVSRSRFWKDTAIFVVEDDAQNGPDHVDAHRTVALVISPYTRGAHVDSSLYSTTSMLRTMELILGLKPLSQFDAAARPMYASFHATPDLRPYQHLVPDADLKAKNQANAPGAALSATFDFSQEDLADDLLFNEVVWQSVRGRHTPMPPPVRAAFVVPHVQPDRDDD
ncbi:MAG: bifunctional YncE family protein/alkaline phosphatase family protein [Planctomycetes bacterium]|nr:bifunctional YncE family protein/alkaline phosphatase family protein [Planctomycetota bacterium]